jgi:hypothetical protein
MNFSGKRLVNMPTTLLFCQHRISKQFHHSAAASAEDQGHVVCSKIVGKIDYRLPGLAIGNIRRPKIYGNIFYSLLLFSHISGYYLDLFQNHG